MNDTQRDAEDRTTHYATVRIGFALDANAATPERLAHMIAEQLDGTALGFTFAIVEDVKPLTKQCRHCGRAIERNKDGAWIDPEAGGDDSIWRELCDRHDGSFTAEHEPATETADDAPADEVWQQCPVCGMPADADHGSAHDDAGLGGWS
jgi:hypothetical protein